MLQSDLLNNPEIKTSFTNSVFTAISYQDKSVYWVNCKNQEIFEKSFFFLGLGNSGRLLAIFQSYFKTVKIPCSTKTYA